MTEEIFDAQERELLSHFVTDVDANVFVLRNLPEVIKGALFSRYSRSQLGLRKLLLKDFIQNKETAFSSIAAAGQGNQDEQVAAIQKAQNFYDRILDGYGDDSIGELGGAHLACENLSMLAAKIIEDKRIGGSPLEKSARYVAFDEKENGQYRYYREPKLMRSKFAKLYEQTCDALFDAYSNLIPKLTEKMQEVFPPEEGGSPRAYKAALRAKVLDCVRGLLPAATVTNLGVFGNGRFFENLIRTSNEDRLEEIREFAKESYTQLAKVMPSFIRRANPEHHNQQSYAEARQGVETYLDEVTKELLPQPEVEAGDLEKVRFIDCDEDALWKVARALLFSRSQQSIDQIERQLKEVPEEKITSLFAELAAQRKNRRHKSPRALENAFFTFEVVTDFGAYRDLHRHRLLTQERQLLSCNLGYEVPEELVSFGLDKPYREAMEQAAQAYSELAKEFPEEAQYIVPLGYNIRWYMRLNLRALQWMCELRSTPAGHPSYRYVAQAMAEQVSQRFPAFAPFFKFVDFDGYSLGRLQQEERKEKKQAAQV